MTSKHPELTDDVIRQARRLECELDSMFFNRYFFKSRTGAKMVVGQHHPIIADTLEKVVTGEITRLVVNLPPGYTKTEQATINFIARGLAINPRARFLHLSYSDVLALLNSSKTREIIKSTAFQTMWTCATKDDADSKKMWWLEEGGGMYATSTFGQVTGHRAGLMEDGFTGALIIDDPIKPADANSETIREAINNNYQETIASRLATEDVPIIVIMQRVHWNDLSGFLLRGGSGEEWHHLNLPVILDDSKPYPEENTHGIPIEHGLPNGWLWPAKHNAKHEKALRSHKRKWNAQYMQGPKKFDEEGALWTEALIQAARDMDQPWKLCRTVVAVDPAVSNDATSDDTGIVVAQGYTDGDFSVEADYTINSTTDAWAQEIMDVYKAHNCDAVVVEVNNGGDLVENVLRLKGFEGRVINVHAAKGKFARAEPVAALYEQGRVKHNGDLVELESEVMEYVPSSTKKSPNRLDALVWALWELAHLDEGFNEPAGAFGW